MGFHQGRPQPQQIRNKQRLTLSRVEWFICHKNSNLNSVLLLGLCLCLSFIKVTSGREVITATTRTTTKAAAAAAGSKP